MARLIYNEYYGNEEQKRIDLDLIQIKVGQKIPSIKLQDMDIEQTYDFLTDSFAFHLQATFLGTKNTGYYSVPSNWFEHLKADLYPKLPNKFGVYLTKRFPVRIKAYSVERTVVFPTLPKVYNHEPYIFYKY